MIGMAVTSPAMTEQELPRVSPPLLRPGPDCRPAGRPRKRCADLL